MSNVENKNDKEEYIDPEIVKKYGLDKQEVTFFTGFF